VPDHKELARGTLRTHILQAGIKRGGFLAAYDKA
jgi:hypothetical protein